MTTPAAILQAVAFYYGVRPQDLAGPRRDHHVTMPRFVAMYLTRQMIELSFPLIGEFYGRDHSTVIAAVKKVEACLEEGGEGRDESVAAAVQDIRQAVLPSAGPDLQRLRRTLEASRKALLRQLAQVDTALSLLPKGGAVPGPAAEAA